MSNFKNAIKDKIIIICFLLLVSILSVFYFIYVAKGIAITIAKEYLVLK